MRMKSSWVKGPKRIVEIATSIVGKKTIEGIKSSGDHMSTYHMLAPSVLSKVQKMSPEKLGEICGYAGTLGYHTVGSVGQGPGPTSEHSQEPPPAFVSDTGYRDLLTDKELGEIFRENSFLEIMERIATLTLIAIAIDIAWQDSRRERWGKD